MIFFLCVGIAAMTAGGIFLLLASRLVQSLFGIALLSNAVNLSLLLLGGVRPGVDAPIIPESADILHATAADPMPQAMVLTAIVIGFGMLAYLATLLNVGRPYFENQNDLHEGGER